MNSIESSNTQNSHNGLGNNKKLSSDEQSTESESKFTLESSTTSNLSDKNISSQKKQNIFIGICQKVRRIFTKDKEKKYKCVMCNNMFTANKIRKNPCGCISCKKCEIYERREYWWMIGCVIKDECKICGHVIIVEER